MIEDDYDAIVYDLDGTIVSLDVDWRAVAIDVLEVYAAAAVDAPSENLWDLLSAATDAGLADEVEATIAAYEREGARTAARLPRSEDLLSLDRPVGVCSLNCEAACRIALERHDLLDAVDAVVGRDTVETRKPDPGPLLETVRRLSATADRSLFVGDSERDERTARRAGTDFAYVEADDPESR